MVRRRNSASDLVRACLELLSLRGVLAWRNNTTGVYDPTIQRFRKFNGRKGVSDILGVLPGGRLLAVECKHGTGRLSKEQKLFMADVTAYGGLAVVVRSVDELNNLLAFWLDKE